ncbi:MAG: porin [Deltaproteobacteria bacterium]|nr:porin [Deltaproteobacteria bacterium]
MKKILAIFAITALLSAFALTTAASEFNFYGSIRYNTISIDKEGNNESFYGETGTSAYAPSKSDRDTGWGLWGHSRVGAAIKLSDQLTGVFELGIGDGTLGLRHYYGEYDFGYGKILVGQTWHPSSAIACYSSQIWDGDDGLGEHGAFYGGRSEMIKLSFGNFGLYFIEPVVKGFDKYSGATPFGQNNPEFNGVVDVPGDYDKSIPQIAASYSFTYDKLTVEGMAAYQHYEFTDQNHTHESGDPRPTYENSLDVDSHFFKIGATLNLDPFTFSGSYGWGDNIDNMGISAYSAYGYTPTAIFSDGLTSPAASDGSPFGIYDVETYGYTLVAGVKINDMLSLETGYGYIDNESDNWAYANNSDAHSYYLQARIKIVDGFVITPEIGKIEYNDIDTLEFSSATPESRVYNGGDITYFGAKWQIDF